MDPDCLEYWHGKTSLQVYESVFQVSSSVPMATDASHRRGCAMGRGTVRTALMKWIVQVKLRAAITAATTTLAAYHRPSCVMAREIVPMARMKKNVVGDFSHFTELFETWQMRQACFLLPGLVPCSFYQFRCASGQCVSEALRCDGYPDCSDRSDEAGCAKSPRCPAQLQCPHSHECLQKEWLCDGDEDCKDGSDEKVRTKVFSSFKRFGIVLSLPQSVSRTATLLQQSAETTSGRAEMAVNAFLSLGDVMGRRTVTMAQMRKNVGFEKFLNLWGFLW